MAKPAYKSGFAALIGRPNAGKSTLLNRLVGEKIAAVSNKPQTTRHRIVGVRNSPDGQMVFIDTPGIHKPVHRMNQRMVDTAVETLREVDVVVVLVLMAAVRVRTSNAAKSASVPSSTSRSTVRCAHRSNRSPTWKSLRRTPRSPSSCKRAPKHYW